MRLFIIKKKLIKKFAEEMAYLQIRADWWFYVSSGDKEENRNMSNMELEGVTELRCICNDLGILNEVYDEAYKIYDKRRMKLKKKILGLLVAGILAASTLTGCDTEAERVSYNLSQQADNFNVVRQLTVINCIEGDVLFQMTGRMSIKADTADNQLEIIVEDGDTYVKHFVGLSDNVTYVVEDLNLGANAVSKYKYTLNFNPNMWIPVNVETID